jgi:hypothetical protein
MTDRRYTASMVVLALSCILASCGPTPAEQHALDLNTCQDYGFTPGTDAFANCMMLTAQHRVDQAAADRRQQDLISANTQALAISRNGDTRYPVCNAASRRARLDISNAAWYGESCREK